MDVSIIIVNYNTASLVDECINSVKEKTEGVSYEIIIVDNASTDNIREIPSLSAANTKLILSQTNLGFGKANNLGAQKAVGKYLFFLNGDTLLKNNAVKILFDYINNHSDVGAVGGNIFNAEGKPAHSFSLRLPSLSRMFKLRVLPYRLYAQTHEDEFIEFNNTGFPMEVGYITGADLMIRKELFDAIGGFDKDFFMYAEESELQSRVKNAGYKIVSVPKAEITHLEGASMQASSDVFNERRYRLMSTQSQYLYYDKVYGKRAVKWYYIFARAELILKRSIPYRKEKSKILKQTYKEWKTTVECKGEINENQI